MQTLTTPASAENIGEWQQRYDLKYHVNFALEAQREIGLSGQRVLEVGGSLPEGFVLDVLEARQWIAIEDIAYWNEHPQNSNGTRPPICPMRKLADVDSAESLGEHEIVIGGVEDLPVQLHRQFDVVFSIACFEHILRMPLALDRMYKALRPGGKLYAAFCPIWSAHDGHHLPTMIDDAGRKFSFGSSPIPKWGHLLMRPDEMMKHLQNHTDFETAAKMVYYIYHSPHINRLFAEDYEALIGSSGFEIEKLAARYFVPVPQAIQAQLMELHPGRSRFNNNGFMAVLTRP